MTQSETGAMAFDPEAVLAHSVVTRHVWAPEQTILYALGIGAEELAFLYEEQLQVLPMMAVVLGYPGMAFWGSKLGVGLARYLHGETEVEIHTPLPVAGEMVGEQRVVNLFDKGADKGAVAMLERPVFADGVHVATVRNTAFLRGNGGFGGSAERQPKPRPIPDRAPDAIVSLTTLPTQALLYRLSGDNNPLHADPMAARAAGFPAPILHGLCTFGFAGRAVLRALCNNDPSSLTRLGVRFSSPVFPGETIRTEIWHEQAGRAAFRSSVVERGVTVLNNGYVEFA
jgi:acyl dehydratase